jgi:hypothetical protein
MQGVSNSNFDHSDKTFSRNLVEINESEGGLQEYFVTAVLQRISIQIETWQELDQVYIRRRCG